MIKEICSKDEFENINEKSYIICFLTTCSKISIDFFNDLKLFSKTISIPIFVMFDEIKEIKDIVENYSSNIFPTIYFVYSNKTYRFRGNTLFYLEKMAIKLNYVII
jgi:hypothetical protein